MKNGIIIEGVGYEFKETEETSKMDSIDVCDSCDLREYCKIFFDMQGVELCSVFADGHRSGTCKGVFKEI